MITQKKKGWILLYEFFDRLGFYARAELIQFAALKGYWQLNFTKIDVILPPYMSQIPTFLCSTVELHTPLQFCSFEYIDNIYNIILNNKIQ